MNGRSIAAARMHIGVVAQSALRGQGQGRAVLELIKALVRRGHEVTVLAHSLDDEILNTVEFVRVPRFPGPQVVDDLAMMLGSTLRLRLRQFDVTCVVGPTAIPKGPCAFYAHFSHRGWMATWHADELPDLRYRLSAYVLRALEAICVRRCSLLLSPSRSLADQLMPRPTSALSIVPNGVDVEEFSTPTPLAREDARRTFGLGDAPVVAFLGDYATNRKGLNQLMAAIALGPDNERLIVAGTGHLQAARERARHLGVDHKIVWAGQCAPRLVYEASDVVAVPSIYEPYSLVALEAAACEIPVVLSKRAGVCEVLDDAVLVVDPTSPGSLRQALDRAESLQPRLSLPKAARLIAESLTWPRSMEAAAEALEHLANV